MNLTNEQQLAQLEEIFYSSRNSEDEIQFLEAIKPIKKSISLEEMVEVQNYHPIKKEAFFKKTNALEIEETLEDLLSMLD